MKKDRVPEILVEKLALGELPEVDAARVRDSLGDDAEARLSALAREDAEILERLPPDEVAAEVRRRLAATERDVARSRASGVSPWIPALVLGAAAVVAWLWIRAGEEPRKPDTIARSDVTSPSDDGADTSEIVYVKGDARLWIDKKGPAGAQRLANGDVVGQGDRLQVHYDAADRELGVIVSIDGRGVATLHSPGDPEDEPALEAGGAVALDHSYELDDAPAFERFFFVTAPRGEALRVSEVMKAARELAARADAETAPLPVRRELEQTSILLKKPR